VLKHNSALESINLSGNLGGTRRTLVYNTLTIMLSHNRRLTQLIMRQCGLGDNFALHLSEGLHNAQKIEHIDLSGNRITCEGAASIALALCYRVNSSVRYLDMSNNRIGDLGGKKLAQMVRINKGVRTLKLSHNELGAETGQEMLDGVKENTSLEQLDLSDNLIPVHILTLIAKHLKHAQKSKVLQELPKARAKLIRYQNVRKELRSVKRAIFETEKEALVEQYHADKELHRF
jgi:Ran GTPase-activating protein (RanGAP) involved in mRNA processing and transport